jgi:hypothetical protein
LLICITEERAKWERKNIKPRWRRCDDDDNVKEPFNDSKGEHRRQKEIKDSPPEKEKDRGRDRERDSDRERIIDRERNRRARSREPYKQEDDDSIGQWSAWPLPPWPHNSEWKDGGTAEETVHHNLQGSLLQASPTDSRVTRTELDEAKLNSNIEQDLVEHKRRDERGVEPHNSPAELIISPAGHGKSVFKEILSDAGTHKHQIAQPSAKRGTPAEYSDSDEDSYQHSFFSIGQSSATSQISIISDSISNPALEQLVSLLLGQEALKLLCVEAIETIGIGPDRFERNFRTLLKGYAAELRKSVTDAQRQQLAAASFVAYRARIIAARVRQFCNEGYEGRRLKLPTTKEDKIGQVEKNLEGLDIKDPQGTPSRGDDGSSESSADDNSSGGEGSGNTTHLSAVRDLLINGTAFQTLCDNLASFIRPSWERRLDNFGRSVSKGKDVFRLSEDDLARLKLLIANITEVDLHSIVIYESYEQTWYERMQVRLEKETRTTWNWWPLSQPRPKPRKDRSFIKSRCVRINLGQRDLS